MVENLKYTTHKKKNYKTSASVSIIYRTGQTDTSSLPFMFRILYIYSIQTAVNNQQRIRMELSSALTYIPQQNQHNSSDIDCLSE